MSKEYSIWMEGFSATGQQQGAQLIGQVEASSFDEAVQIYIERNPTAKIELNKRNKYISDEYYDKRCSNWNIWGCNLFDNELDARKSYG